MTVSRPLSIVLQLVALWMIVSAGFTAQQGDVESALPVAIGGLVVLVFSRMKAKK